MPLRKIALLIIVTAVLCWQFVPRFVTSSHGDIWEPCSTYATATGGCYLACPEGDGSELGAIGATITVYIKDFTGQPIANIPATDFWLIGCDDNILPCGGSHAIDADSMTNQDGVTTISGSFEAGGCEPRGVMAVVQGVVISGRDNCEPLCLPITTISVDVAPTDNPDLVVDLIDLSYFADGYSSPPKTYDACIDFNCDGYVDIIDLSIFAQHYLHSC
jgi:hypothetical protein